MKYLNVIIFLVIGLFAWTAPEWEG